VHPRSTVARGGTLLLIATFAVAACGSASTLVASPSPSSAAHSLPPIASDENDDLNSFADASPASQEPDPTDDPDDAVTARHDAPEMEPLIPDAIAGAALEKDSDTGASFLGDDPLSEALSALLRTAGKQPEQLRIATATDQASDLDLQLSVYRMQGVSAQLLAQAIEAGWQSDDPDFKLETQTIAGKPVARGGYGPGDPTAFWYVHGEDVYEIQTGDQSIAQTALAALP
jgi:hypothetical protein